MKKQSRQAVEPNLEAGFDIRNIRGNNATSSMLSQVCHRPITQACAGKRRAIVNPALSPLCQGLAKGTLLLLASIELIPRKVFQIFIGEFVHASTCLAFGRPVQLYLASETVEELGCKGPTTVAASYMAFFSAVTQSSFSATSLA